MSACPKCGGPEHEAFTCHKFVWESTEDGYRLIQFGSEREARSYVLQRRGELQNAKATL